MTPDFNRGTVPLESFGRVHMIGIGGAGMSVIARLLAARGVAVQGSDAKGGVSVDALRAAGIHVWIGHNGANVRGADTVVVSSAVRPDNPELVAAERDGALVLHRSQALAALMTGTRSVAVAGAHGKTTTSAMVAVVLGAAGLDPSFAVGGSVRTPTGAVTGGHLGQGDVLVAEADESDGSFLNYAPSLAVVTNVEPDHLDHYGSREAFEQAFVEFAARIAPGGHLVACADDPGARTLARTHRAAGRSAVTYGFDADADLRVLAWQPRESGSSVTVALSSRICELVGQTQGVGPLNFELAVPGRFNALNAAAALAVALLLGVEPAAAVRGLEAFLGTGRRFEPRGEVAGVRVVDDYAHHPTEVGALLTAARDVARPGRVLALFQPHLFSRTRAFAAEFAAALDLADVAIVTDIYAAREDPEPGVNGKLIVDAMATRGISVPDRIEAAERIADLAEPGDLVLTVGAGDVTELGETILDRLGSR